MSADEKRVKTTRTMGKVVALLVAVVLCFTAGFIGAFFPPGEWYASLERPALTPPGWLFGPVWTLLYLMMAVSAWMVWLRRPGVRLPLGFFAVQLLLNAAWSGLFFGMQNPSLALVDILLLWGMILGTIITFWKVNRWAGSMLIPYLVWVSFATYLNFGFWRLNG